MFVLKKGVFYAAVMTPRYASACAVDAEIGWEKSSCVHVAELVGVAAGNPVGSGEVGEKDSAVEGLVEGRVCR